MTEIANTESFSRAFWRTAIALACALLATNLMNSVVFPLFDDVFTFARDISQTAQAALFLGVGVAATFRPWLLKPIHFDVLGFGFLAAGIALLPVSLALDNAPLLVVASTLFAIARGIVLIAVTQAMARLLDARQTPIAVALAFVAAAAGQAICWVVPIFVGLALYSILPVIAFALVYRDAKEMGRIATSGEAPADVAITRPETFLPLASEMFVCLFLFRVAFGYSLRFGENAGVPVDVFLAIVPVAAAALLLLLWKRFDADLLAQVSVPLVAAGFLFVNSSDVFLRDFSNVALSSGNSLFNMVSWIVIVSVGARNHAGSLAVAGWGHGVGSIGTLVGAALGVWSNHLFEHDATMLMLVTGLLLVLFVGYAVIGMRTLCFREIIEGVVPAEPAPVVTVSAEDRFAERCRQIAEEYHLTPRELEVFEMLARGRDRAYIQEKLVVSRNTVKAHVRHVYEKLEIHSHQELIDLVE